MEIRFSTLMLFNLPKYKQWYSLTKKYFQHNPDIKFSSFRQCSNSISHIRQDVQYVKMVQRDIKKYQKWFS